MQLSNSIYRACQKLSDKVRPSERRTRRSVLRRLGSPEALEGRELFAAGFGLSGGVLTITADDGGSNVIIQDLNPTPQYRPSAPDMLLVHAYSDDGSWVVPIPKLAVNQIHFEGSSVRDTFDASSLGYNMYGMTIPITANGNGGNDTLEGGMGNDRLDGGGGNDKLVGNGGRDELLGGAHTDWLYGDADTSSNYYTDSGDTRTSSSYRGGGNDTLRGGSGSDYLYGGGGDDTLEGESGNDRLYGNHGDDTLRGGIGDDWLYGQVGDDNLYGEDGNDYLFGYGGNDGLVGGTGSDYLRGHAGADRFLVITNAAGSPVSDRFGEILMDEDAKVNFVNGSTTDVRLGSGIGLVRAYADSWTSAELEKVDLAFEAFVDIRNSTEMLKKSNGDEVSFIRYGAVRNINADGSLGSVNRTVGGWNGGGQIAIVDNRFNSTTDEVVRVVFHELAHNWDETGENAFIPAFRRIAGWQSFATSIPAGWEGAGDPAWSNWAFRDRDRNLDGFARSYGKMNPLEDWATSVAAYMMAETGRDYKGESPEQIRSRMGARFALLDQFFAQY